MTKKPKPSAAAPAKPPRPPLPAAGGSYVRQPDGSLERQPHPKAAVEAPVKEA